MPGLLVIDELGSSVYQPSPAPPVMMISPSGSIIMKPKSVQNDYLPNVSFIFTAHFDAISRRKWHGCISVILSKLQRGTWLTSKWKSHAVIVATVNGSSYSNIVKSVTYSEYCFFQLLMRCLVICSCVTGRASSTLLCSCWYWGSFWSCWGLYRSLLCSVRLVWKKIDSGLFLS